MADKINIFWFRRDLRLSDNAGLYYALKTGTPVLPIFIFDTKILDRLENKSDARVTFIFETIVTLKAELENLGATLKVYYGTPALAFADLIKKFSISSVFTNEDYEPYAKERDTEIISILTPHGITFSTFKDQVIFGKNEIIKEDGKPYTVFTPYSRKWKAALNDFQLRAYPVKKYLLNLMPSAALEMPLLGEMGFQKPDLEFPEKNLQEELILTYSSTRDFPGIRGTSHLGLHLRFGTISIRELARYAGSLSETYLNELIWRDFYQMILWQFPSVGHGKAFKPAYDEIEWERDNGNFAKWCEGKTGYPIVDAGMRELNATGFMHNRVRMITASFLCKHLLIDWRLGEAYFAGKLLDYDFASNNGGWQWAAGSGCDAAPYFRIFNPTLQMKKFDPNFEYVRKWVPEFEDFGYPEPIVNHEFARKRCLERYSKALKKEVI